MLIIILMLPFVMYLILSLFTIISLQKKTIPPPALSDDDIPGVAVLLPFYNEDCSTLQQVLESIDSQYYPARMTVLVINDGSTNASNKMAEEWCGKARKHDFICIDLPTNSGRKGLALDRALAEVRLENEIFVIIDSDTVIHPRGVYELCTKLWSDKSYAAVCGFIVPERNRTWINTLQFYEHMGIFGSIRTAQDKFGIVSVMAGAFVAHRATVVDDIGGWGNWLVEDISWCWKALSKNYKTGYTVKAKATTVCPDNFNTLFHQRRRWSRGRMEAVKEAGRVNLVSLFKLSPFILTDIVKTLCPPILVSTVILFLISWQVSVLVLLLWLISSVALLKLFYGNYLNIFDRRMYVKTILSCTLLECIIWVPNIFGYLDEILCKRKHWLTR